MSQDKSAINFTISSSQSLISKDILKDVKPSEQQKEMMRSPEEQQVYKLYPKRWIIIILFGFAEFCSTFIYSTFTPIAIDIGKIFDQKAFIVTLSATLYLLMHPFFTFPASYLIISKGPAFSVKLGAALTILGTLIRCTTIYSRFEWILVGQILSGIGRPFILNAQANITSNWFPLKSRTQIITILNSLITISGIMGYNIICINYHFQLKYQYNRNVVPSVFYRNYIYEDDDEDLTIGLRKFRNLVLSEAALCVLLLTPLFILLESNAPTPPSQYANLQDKVNFKDSIKQLFRDNKFVFILLSFTFFNGTWKGFGVSLAYIVHPFGYGSSAIAIFAVTPVIGGIFSTVFAPKLYRKIGAFKPIILMLQIFTIISFFLFFLACYLKNMAIIITSTIFIGAFIMPTVPFLIEWACKQIYPINDSFSVGILYSGATLFSSFIGEILTIVIDGEHATDFYGIALINALYLMAFFLILFVKEKSLRSISVKQSFNSIKVFKTMTENSVSDLFFKIFPQTNPDGGLNVYFDNLDNQKVENSFFWDETDEDKKNKIEDFKEDK